MTAQQSVRGDVAVLVAAAGLGVRLGPGAPKALRPLAGEPLWEFVERWSNYTAPLGLLYVRGWPATAGRRLPGAERG